MREDALASAGTEHFIKNDRFCYTWKGRVADKTAAFHEKAGPRVLQNSPAPARGVLDFVEITNIR